MAGASRAITAVLLAIVLGSVLLSSPVRAAVAPDVAAPTPTAARLLDGAIVSVSGSKLIAQMSDGIQHSYIVPPTAPVTRNSQRGNLTALRPDDQVTVTQDAHGRITAVDAAGPETADSSAHSSLTSDAVQGTVVAVWAGGIAAQLGANVRDIRLTPSLRITRNGRASRAAALRSGDAITVTTDAAGAVTAVAAVGRPIISRTPTTADAAALAAPPLVALLLAAITILYRQTHSTAHSEGE